MSDLTPRSLGQRWLTFCLSAFVGMVLLSAAIALGASLFPVVFAIAIVAVSAVVGWRLWQGQSGW